MTHVIAQNLKPQMLHAGDGIAHNDRFNGQVFQVYKMLDNGSVLVLLSPSSGKSNWILLARGQYQAVSAK